jgi:hypothetical protein
MLENRIVQERLLKKAKIFLILLLVLLGLLVMEKEPELLSKTNIHARYADGTAVLEDQQPPRIKGPDPNAMGPHTVLRYDEANGKIYQGREFDSDGNPVRDVDFTSPTLPDGTPRLRHPGPPHQHRFVMNVPMAGPSSGYKRLGPENL